MTAPSSAAQRPLPPLDEPDTREFWAATARHQLTYQVCSACGGIVFFPRAHCTHCTSRSLETRTSAGTGTVYTYTVVRQHGQPFFRAHTPYVLGFVDLDEGFRMLAEIGAEPDAVSVGQRVEVDWEDHDQVSVPIFRPAGPTRAGPGSGRRQWQ
jgi:uncharacterized protein